MEHASRRLIHLNATAHPAAAWTLQQLRETIPSDHQYRFIIHDHDAIFSAELDASLTRLGLKVITTPVRSPQANSLCERLIGTLRRECLDWIIPLSERQLRNVLVSWMAHYNRGRPHSALGPGIPARMLSDLPVEPCGHRLPIGRQVVARNDSGRTASRVQAGEAGGVTLAIKHPGEKTAWHGVLRSVQPRIRLTRSFDQRSHTYLGYALKVRGTIGSEARDFLVGVGQGAHAKHQFQAGAAVSGEALPVPDPRLEAVEFYKVSNLKVGPPEAEDEESPPPWRGVPPPLAVYRERGHRRLAARTFQEKCWKCIWGCRMPVEMIIDQWNPSRRRYRTETFCYGPLSCRLYHAGPARAVPGRRGMTYTEEDWVDDDATSHRGPDE